MTVNEFNFLIYISVCLLSIIAFVGVLFINSFMKMAKDINEIKTTISVQATKHEGLERRVTILENGI